MKKLLLLLFGFALASLAGCASTLELKPVAAKGQQLIGQSGSATLISMKKNVVAIRPVGTSFQSTQHPSFVLNVTNRSNSPFVFGPQNVTVTLDGRPEKVLTYDELVAEARQKADAARIAMVVGVTLELLSAVNSGYTDGSTVRGYGTGRGSGGRWYVVDPYDDDAAFATQLTASSLNMVTEQEDGDLDRLRATILKEHTVAPSDQWGGYIELAKIDPSHIPHDVNVAVTVGQETHNFRFMLSKAARTPTQY